MSTQIQRRRGTTTEHGSFTGAAAEITVDTTKDTIVVHDGSTAGGHPLAKENNPRFTGNVGIGTSAPDGKLHVSTTGEAKFILEGDSDNSANEESSILEFRTDNGAIRHQIQNGGDSKNLEIIAGSEGTTSFCWEQLRYCISYQDCWCA